MTGAGAWSTSWRMAEVRPFSAGTPSFRSASRKVPRFIGWLGRRPGKSQGESWLMAGVLAGRALRFEQEGGHRLGHWGGRVAESECDVSAVVDDVVGNARTGGLPVTTRPIPPGPRP